MNLSNCPCPCKINNAPEIFIPDLLGWLVIIVGCKLQEGRDLMNLVYSIPITEHRLIWQYLFNERINNSNKKYKDGYVEEHGGKGLLRNWQF